MKNVIEVSEVNFEAEVLKAQQPTVVDFYATWCGPCKMLAPLLEQLAGEFQGQLRFAKINVDEAPTLAGALQITGVPTLMLFRNGEAVDSMVGLASPKALRTWLGSAAAQKAAANA